MEKRFNKDQFEDYFQDRLQDDTPADNEWNVPPAPVWENIQQEISAEPNAANKGLYLLLLLLIAMACVVLFSSNKNSTSNLHNTDTNSIVSNYPKVLPATPSTKEQSSTKDKVFATNENKLKEPANTLDNVVQFNDSNEKADPKINNDRTILKRERARSFAKSNTPSLRTTLSQMNGNPQTEMRRPLLNAEHDNQTSLLDDTVDKLNTVQTLSKNDFGILSPLQKDFADLTLNYFRAIDDDINIEFSADEIDRTTVPNQWAIGLFYRPAFGWNKIEKINAATDLPLNASNQFNHNFGIDIEKWIGKNWIIGSGLQYSNYQFKTQYDLNVAYTSNNEFLGGDGHYHNTYSHSLPTVSGAIDMTHILFRQNSDVVSEGEDIPFLLELSHNIKMLSVPVYAKYMIRRGNFEYSIAGGTLVNFHLNSLETEITNLTSRHNKIHHNQSLAESNATGNQVNMSWAYFIRPALSYYINPKLAINLQPSFRGNITPISKNDLIKVYPNNLGVDLGLYIKF